MQINVLGNPNKQGLKTAAMLVMAWIRQIAVEFLYPMVEKIASAVKEGFLSFDLISKRKLFMQIRFMTILLLAAILQVSAKGLGQKVTYEARSVSLQKVFTVIKEQTGYLFFYRTSDLNDTKPVSVQLNDVPFREALEIVLKDQPLSFEIEGNTVVITRSQKINIIPDRPEIITSAINVRGTVVNSKGEALSGVSVTVKGANTGTSTNENGIYSISVSGNTAILVFSYVGFVTQEITVNKQTVINVKLIEDTRSLGEVVITSFGIKRDKNLLGYGVSEVKSDDLEKAPTTDITNALAGKMAGVQVSGAGGGFAGSNVTIRGFSTFLGSNQPLYVIDGIPIDNSGGENSFNTGAIESSRIQDINPQDVDNVTVLKGAAATVLYGSRGASGVILITTKKGKAGKRNEVNFTTNTGIGTVSRFPEFQNEYAQGAGGKYINNIASSWGPLIQGQEVTNWFGDQEKLTAYPNNVRDILHNSYTTDNNLSFSDATDKYNYRVSYGYSSQNGLVPNNKITKNNLSVNAGTQIFKKLNISTSFSYVNNISDLTQAGNQGSNPLWRGIYTPRSYDLTHLPYEDEEGNQLWFAGEDQPYWAIEHVKRHREINRFYGNIDLKYDIVDWLHADLKIGTDIYNSVVKGFDEKGIRGGGNTGSGGIGGLLDKSRLVRDINSYFTISGNRRLSKNLKLTATIGNEISSNYNNLQQVTGLGLLAPEFQNIKNFLTYTPLAYIEEFRNIGIFADVVFDYKDFLSINAKARNDFTSTLPKGARSIFYPAVSLSFVATNAFPSLQSDFLSSAKVRANFGEVGKGTSPYSLETYFIQAGGTEGRAIDPQAALAFPFGGLAGFTYSNGSGNAKLRPEFTKEVELGVDLVFFNNRMSLDASIYQRDTRDLIFNIPLPQTSGFSNYIGNSGKLSTKGLEFLISGTPVKTKYFSWNSSLNFTRFKSMVTELAPGVSNLVLGGFSATPNISIQPGKEYGQIYASAYLRDDQGRMIIGSNGLPKLADGAKIVGNQNPLFTAGFSNSFSYKNFSLSFLVSLSYKGDILSRTEGDLRINGVAKETAEYPRFNADGTPNKPYKFDGVLEDGSPNNVMLSAEDYFGKSGIYAAWEGYVLDATFLKLREMNLTYHFPAATLKNIKFIKRLQVSLYGRNLLTYAPHYPGIDPEQSLMGISNARGLEFGILPTPRTIGASINVTF